MCRYTTTYLSFTDCDLYRTDGLAHQYTKYVYLLCRDSRDGTPCSNNRPTEDQIGNDFGSRQGPCPVCMNIRNADEKYNLAVQRATEAYYATVKKAYHANVTELEEAKYVVETVSFHSELEARIYAN